MEFTYGGYNELIDLLKEKNYEFKGYHNYGEAEKCVIMKHDVDYELERSVIFAEMEAKKDIKSTYFVLLTSDFYNLFSKNSFCALTEIMKYGHEIGLHFDEVKYQNEEGCFDNDRIVRSIRSEADILSQIIGKPIKSVSMHRPSELTLMSNLQIPGLINSYSQEFFQNFKYVSDSRMRWRENVREIIDGGGYNRLHILTHAFWYQAEPLSMKKIVEAFINEGQSSRYEYLNDNITNLNEILKIEP